MPVVVTTCSINHLAQAKSLGDSLLQFQPGCKLVIGLVDRIDGRIDKQSFQPHDIVEAHEMNISEFEQMAQQYSTYELNCALKSFFMAYVMKQYQPDTLFFLDSDMRLFDSLQYLEELLTTSSILLTPHIFSSFPQDGKTPQEKDILKAGIYNAGFLALRNDEIAHGFLSWWTDRMKTQCFEKPKQGLNVDQNWLNFVPLYFKNVYVVAHPGCNVAYWNLHERKLENKNDHFIVNENFPLIFFHYSGYDLSQPARVSKHDHRHTVSNLPAVKMVLDIYDQSLKKNKHSTLSAIPCFYKKKKTFWQKIGLKK